MNVEIMQEVMADHLIKWHILGLPFSAVIHKIGADTGDPHTHPWPFTSHMLKGWYTEEIYFPDGSTVKYTYGEGTARHVPLNHVHRIIEASDECYTVIVPHPKRGTQKPGFYRWVDGVRQHRFWDEDWS